MSYIVSFGDYRFRFNNFIDAANLATTIAEDGEKSCFVKDEDEKNYHYEWNQIKKVSIEIVKEEAPTASNDNESSTSAHA